jgi:hypothetical protein
MGDNPDELVKQSQEMEPPQIQQQNPALVEAASRVESPLTFV